MILLQWVEGWMSIEHLQHPFNLAEMAAGIKRTDEENENPWELRLQGRPQLRYFPDDL